MSRIGKKTIPVPEGVKLALQSGKIELNGPQGSISQELPTGINVEYNEERKIIDVTRPNNLKQSRALHGLVRALIANAVHGVSQGFHKRLEIVGTGYNAKLKGKHLELQIGFCLPRALMIPDGITVEVPTPTKILIKGCDKHQVGQFAADIHAIRSPDSYKGKGIKYEGEVIKLKAGKAFAGAGG